MHRVKLERGRERGHFFVKVFIDGKQEDLCLASRALTGTSHEANLGIFTENSSETFTYGEERKEFNTPAINFKTDTLEWIERVLRHRIEIVKDWVDSIDYQESITFEVE